MILSGLRIKDEIRKGSIVINPYDESCVNPNSYNLHLGDTLRMYKKLKTTPFDHLNVYKDNPTREIRLLTYGYYLYPGTLYLGSTLEYSETHGFVPMLEGRSSLARLGITVHRTAGFGDVGFCGNWTLEITCVHPVLIYPGMPICQIAYHTVSEPYEAYHGRYQNDRGPQASRLYLDWRGTAT